jgi:hypothetical protein
MRLEKKYSPDQERDENGRFGSGGGMNFGDKINTPGGSGKVVGFGRDGGEQTVAVTHGSNPEPVEYPISSIQRPASASPKQSSPSSPKQASSKAVELSNSLAGNRPITVTAKGHASAAEKAMKEGRIKDAIAAHTAAAEAHFSARGGSTLAGTTGYVKHDAAMNAHRDAARALKAKP